MTTIDDIDNVFFYLESHRAQAAERLFPGDGFGKKAYRKEWEDRTPFKFWCHLDFENRRQLVRFARDQYGPSRRAPSVPEERYYGDAPKDARRVNQGPFDNA